MLAGGSLKVFFPAGFSISNSNNFYECEASGANIKIKPNCDGN